mgnify:CR=1 FL=1
MKKKNVLNLIKYYSEKNDSAFRNEAYEIARDFDNAGDYQLAEYIMAQLSSTNTFVPQISENDFSFFRKMVIDQEPLPLPEVIKDDLVGIVNAIGHNVGVNKFLFYGAPGTGKTESAKQMARILDRDLYVVDFELIIDSKLGQTSKNIAEMFKQINDFSHPEKLIILFDEIDSIAMDRTNSNDLREMGRATSAILKGFDNLNNQIVLIATTNLYDSFDKALIRRFDKVIDFSQYTNEDLMEVAEVILNYYLDKFKFAGKNLRVFKKILQLTKRLPYPGDLKNIIKTSIAFSKAGDEFDYLRRLYKDLLQEKEINLVKLREQGFTVREIEILTGISKSQVARELQAVAGNE